MPVSKIREYLERLRNDWLQARDRRRALCLAIFCTAMFVLVNWRNYHVDNIPLALMPVSIWRIVGQTLSPHLGAVLCTSALVLQLRDFPLSARKAAWVGFLAGATVVMRPPTGMLLLPLGIYLQLPGLLDGWKARLGSCAGI